jgi:Uma2 family endonuclease
MASLPHPRTVTYEEWLRMPVVRDAIEEVVDGEIRIMPANKWNHASIVRKVRRDLEAQLDEQEWWVLAENFGLIIRTSPLTCRVPDLAVFRKSTIVERDGYIHSAPQLIVEVLSPSNRLRSREELRQHYSTIGLAEFWIVSPEARTIEVLYLENGQLCTSAVLTEGILKPREFPRVQIDIARIWPD